MTWIVETRRPGETVQYMALCPGSRSEYQLTGRRAEAFEFEKRWQASVVIRRFSSAFNLIITEVK